MLDPVPVPLQAVIWPLLGAVLILLGRRFLPNWVRRLVALAAALASLSVLWSLRSGPIERVELLWEPLNLFRMSPNLYPDTLALLVGLTLVWITAGAVLGVRGAQPRSTAWHGLLLVVLAGCLGMSMATNLITLAIASALLDMGLLAMIVFAPHDADRVAWRMVVPGMASTLLLVVGALQMNAQVGSGSLGAREVPLGVLALVGIAGALRLLIYPVHPRNLHTPENAAALLLSAGTGIYLLARVQTIEPGLPESGWMLLIGGVALLAGGLLAWMGSLDQTEEAKPSLTPGANVSKASDSAPLSSGGARQRVAGSLQSEIAKLWSGVAVHQAGFALIFLLMVANSVPWPLFSLTLALGIMLIWWDGTSRRTDKSQPHSPPMSIEKWWMQTGYAEAGRFPTLIRFFMVLLPATALASLAGIPLTAGARGRWLFYGTLLGQTQSGLLLVTLVADSLLIAGLVTMFRTGLKRARDWRPSLAAFLAMLALAIPLAMLGIAPGVLGLETTQPLDIPAWSLGLLYVLPWLLGVLLSRVGGRLVNYAAPVYRFLSLDWLFRAGNWLGQGLSSIVYWVGQVGEGQGWFGWVLIILALGTVLLILR
jgi:hypothetical protein